MDPATRLRRLHFRAWHRGTREADYLVGGFFDRYGAEWSEAELCWFEALLDEQDVDILSWAMGREAPPERFVGEQMALLKKLDYIPLPR